MHFGMGGSRVRNCFLSALIALLQSPHFSPRLTLRMTLGNLLSLDQIIPEMQATERWSAIVELVELLVAHRANVNAQRRDGMTALHAAAYRGHLRVIEALLRAGANPNIRGHADSGAHSGESPLDTALAQSQTAAAEALRAVTAK